MSVLVAKRERERERERMSANKAAGTDKSCGGCAAASFLPFPRSAGVAVLTPPVPCSFGLMPAGRPLVGV